MRITLQTDLPASLLYELLQEFCKFNSRHAIKATIKLSVNAPELEGAAVDQVLTQLKPQELCRGRTAV